MPSATATYGRHWSVARSAFWLNTVFHRSRTAHTDFQIMPTLLIPYKAENMPFTHLGGLGGNPLAFPAYANKAYIMG